MEWLGLEQRNDICLTTTQTKVKDSPNLNLSQIYISEGSEDLSPELQRRSESMKAIVPNAEWKLYRNEECREIIADNFPAEVANAYDRLKPFSYKADLARFCILHITGGWYADIGMQGNGIAVNTNESISLVTFRDINRYTRVHYACDGCLIYAKPRHRAIATAIELILKNVRNRHYGLTPLCPTGPSLWGRALAASSIDNTIILGDSIELTPQHQVKNKALVLPNGTIIAFKKPSQGGDLKGLGAKGTNNYNEFWHSRNVYGEIDVKD